MGDFSKSTITISGEALENKAKQLQKAIKFDRVVTGDGWLKEGQDLASLTGLIHDVQDYELGSANTLVNNQATLRFTIDSSQVKQTYQLREVGVMAHIEDDPTTLTLFCVANAGDTADTIVPSHDGSSATRDQYTIVLKASRKVKMTAKIVIEDQIPLHAETHLTDGDDPIPLVTSERAGLVPVGLNDPKLVLIASDPPHWRPVPLADRTTPGGIPPLDGYAKHYLAGNGRWYRTTPFIMRDTTLYVDPAYSDIWPRFSTLAKALEYLSGENISTGVTVTVELADGTHKIDDVIKFDYPQAQQVRIVGASLRQRIRFTELKEDGDDLILKVESVKGLTVGMSIVIQGEGSGWNMHPGGRTIKHIEYPHVRVSRSMRNVGPWWAEYKGLGNCYLYYYKTKIDCPNNGLLLPNGIGLLSGMAFKGAHILPAMNIFGIYTTGRTSINNVILSGFGRGVTTRGASLHVDFMAAYDCQSDGLVVDVNSSLNGANLYCNGHNGWGVYLEQATGQIGRSFLKGNNGGLISHCNSTLWLNEVTSQFNNIGVISFDRGNIYLGNTGKSVFINANNSSGLYADYGGFIKAHTNGGIIDNCNPLNREVGNDQSYIAVD